MVIQENKTKNCLEGKFFPRVIDFQNIGGFYFQFSTVYQREVTADIVFGIQGT